jgi:hypothetical protein
MKDAVLPDCRLKDIFIRSAIEQYIDHLEGMFTIRKGNEKMDTEIKDYIKNKLSLNDTPQNNLNKINERLGGLGKTRDKLEHVREEMEVKCLEKWYEDLEKKFPWITLIDQSDAERYAKVGIIVNCKGNVLPLYIEKDGRNIYYGIGKHYKYKNDNEFLNNFLSPILRGFKKSEWWYGYKYSNYDEVYDSYINLVSSLFELAEINPDSPVPLPVDYDD